VEHAQAAAEAAGFVVRVTILVMTGLRASSGIFVDPAPRSKKEFGRVCLISGGEVTVKVTNGGIGGRNQQFALVCAMR